MRIQTLWIFLLLSPVPVFGSGAYMVVDLSGGPTAKTWPVTYRDAPPAGGWGDAFKTSKLVLRRVPAGTFVMGSAEGCSWAATWRRETRHEVTLTRDFYVGVFEVTQAQWRAVLGEGRFADFPGDAHPANRISYEMARGYLEGCQWPMAGAVDEASFFGRLRAHTGKTFDLPTEAQWEYACRAGTKEDLYNGKALTSSEEDGALAPLGRYYYNGGKKEGTAPVGSYQPNAWGLYDCYGNVEEWCLDRQQADLGVAPVRDPAGPEKGLYHVLRGGSWYDSAQSCRSAARNFYLPGSDSVYFGFRVACPAP